jgi:hypothetical protein
MISAAEGHIAIILPLSVYKRQNQSDEYEVKF